MEFERTAGWQVLSPDGQASLHKNIAQPIWGSSTAEIRFKPATPGPHRVFLTPPEPWVGPSLFNIITLWLWDAAPAGLRPDHAIRLLVRDAREGLHEYTLPYLPKDGWQMLHLRVEESPPGPVRIESLEWRMPGGSAPRTLLLEGLHMYQELFGRIPQAVHYVRPHGYAPPFAPLRANSVLLDFPSGPSAFRPLPPAERSVASVRRLEGDVHAFRHEHGGGSLEFRVFPAPGAPDLRVWINDQEWPELWTGFGIETSGPVPELRFARVENQKLTLQYSQGLRYEISLHGRSLQVEAHSLSEAVSVLHLGELGGGGGQETFPLFIPYLRLSPHLRWPVVRLRRGNDEILVSCIPDWWFSLAGRHEAAEESTREGAETLGRMLYPPRWRGSRNIFRERLHLSVSPRLAEVLPAPAAPFALHRDLLSQRLAEGGGEEQAVAQRETLRILPTERVWNDDFLARNPHGGWLPHPKGGFVLKSGFLVREGVARLEEQGGLLRKGWLDPGVAGRLPPWTFTDHDSRMTGGGSFSQTWAELGFFLQQAAAETSLPLVAEGGSEWLMSGFFAGFVSDFPLGIAELHPFLPHIAWRNLQAFSTLMGLGEMEDFRLPGEEAAEETTLLDRLIATQIAYGATGRVPVTRDPLLRRKAERLLAALHPRLEGRSAERIAYASNGGFVDAAEALRLDVLHRSRLYLRLDDQTEIWVNGDLQEDWSLRVGDQQLLLPPFGFVLRGPRSWVMQARQEEGALYSGVATPDRVWLHSLQARSRMLGLDLRGSMQVVRGSDTRPAVLELDVWNGEARIHADVLGLRQVGTVRGEDRSGHPVEAVLLFREGDTWVLRSDKDLRRVTVHDRVIGPEAKFLP